MGNDAQVPLGVSIHDITFGELMHLGPQSKVYRVSNSLAHRLADLHSRCLDLLCRSTLCFAPEKKVDADAAQSDNLWNSTRADLPITLQGLWCGQKVAIKRVAIRTSADLDSFRQEVSLMAAAAHPHIVPLLAARALPPGATCHDCRQSALC